MLLLLVGVLMLFVLLLLLLLLLMQRLLLLFAFTPPVGGIVGRSPLNIQVRGDHWHSSSSAYHVACDFQIC